MAAQANVQPVAVPNVVAQPPANDPPIVNAALRVKKQAQKVISKNKVERFPATAYAKKYNIFRPIPYMRSQMSKE